MQKYNLHERITTPTVSSGVAYTSGDQLGNIKELDSLSGGKLTLAKVLSLAVLDISDQKAQLDLLLFNQDPTADISSADNDAFAMADAGLAKLIGVVPVAAADYVDVSGSSIANVAVTKVVGKLAPTPGKEGKLWVVAIVRGTPTYDAVTALSYRLVLEVND